MRRAAATLALAGVLTAVPVTAAGALGGGDRTTETTTQTPQEGQDPQQAGHPRLRRMAHRIAARAAAGEIDVSVHELRDAVLGGQTIAAFAESKGVDPAAVESAVATVLIERIDEARRNERITEEQATKAKERVDEAAHRIVTSLPRRSVTPTP